MTLSQNRRSSHLTSSNAANFLENMKLPGGYRAVLKGMGIAILHAEAMHSARLLQVGSSFKGDSSFQLAAVGVCSAMEALALSSVDKDIKGPASNSPRLLGSLRL